MKKLLACLILSVLLVGIWAGIVLAGEVLFDSTSVTEDGFTFWNEGYSEWTFEDGILTQSAVVDTYALAAITGNWSKYVLEVTFEPFEYLNEAPYWGVRLHWGLTFGDIAFNCYELTMMHDTSSFWLGAIAESLVSESGRTWEGLKEYKMLPFDFQQVNTLKVIVEANKFTFYLNDTFMGDYTDTSDQALTSGGFGVSTLGNSARFDSIRVTALP